MTWAYAQETGDLYRSGQFVARGYSGFGPYRNDSTGQAIQGLGPIPCGGWTITGVIQETDEHGPFVLTLSPDATTDTFGRSGFLVHGDSISKPGCASHGCIIMPREVRESIWASGDRDLVVVADASQIIQPPETPVA